MPPLSRGAPLRRPQDRALYAAYVLLVAAALATYLATDDGRLRLVAFGTVGLAAPLALLVGLVRFRPRRQRAWLALLVGLSLLIAGDLTELLLRGAPATFDPTPAAFTFLGYGALLLGVYGLSGPLERVSPVALVDAAILALAAGLIIWLVLLEPAAGHLRGLAGALAIGYPTLDAVALASLAPALVRRDARSVAVAVLCVGLVLLPVTDVLAGLRVLTRSYHPGALLDVGWPLAYATLGGAALHPTMGSVGEGRARSAAEPAGVRPGLLAAALLVPPALLAVRALGGLDREDQLPLSVASLALTSLVIVRLYLTTSALARSDARFRSFMAHPGLMAFIKDARGRYQYASPEVERVNGWPSAEAWAERTDRDLFAPDTAAAYGSADETVRRTRTPLILQAQHDEPDGPHVWRLEKFLLPRDAGAIALLGVDITDRVRAEAELRRERELLADAEEVAAFGSWAWDAASAQSQWSPAMRRLAGLPPGFAPLDNAEIYRAIHPEDLARVQAAVRATIATCAPLDAEFRMVGPFGDVRYVHLTGRTEPAADGTAKRVVGVARDETATHAASEQLRLQAHLLESVNDAVIATDAEGRVRYWGGGAAAVLGYRVEEMVDRTLEGVILADTVREDALAAALRAGETYEGDWEARRCDGAPVWLRARISPLASGAGESAGQLWIARDIGARRALELQLERLATAVEQAHEAVVVTDREERIVYANAEFERTTGFSRDEALGQPAGFISAGRQPRAFGQARRALLDSGRPWQGDLVDRRKDGALITTENTVAPVRERDGAVSGYVMVKRDVTRERAAEADAQRRARERALIAETLQGLGGHLGLEDTAEAIAVQVLKLRGISLAALVALDPEGRSFQLAIVSEGGTHQRFDLPPSRSAYLHDRGVLGPWVEAWTPPADGHPYAGLFESLGIRAFAYVPFSEGGSLLGVLAAGSAAPDAGVQLAEHLPALVDFAAIGGALLGPGVRGRQQTAQRRLHVRALIANGAFSPVFQPIAALGDGTLEGFEALTRFANGTPPDVQFAEAHGVGMGLDLELATLAAALKAGARRPTGTSLHVNASVALLLAGDRLRTLLDARATGRLLIEVTEHDRVGDYAAVRQAVERLGPGVRLAVDDAGAGYASLRHILELAPTVVKLDRSLVAGIDGDPARQAVVEGMQQFGRRGGFVLVAEGIETEAERDTLRRLGVPLGQGYLLGRPGPLP